MKLKKEYNNVYSFDVNNNELLLLIKEENQSVIKKINEIDDSIIWEQYFPKISIYEIFRWEDRVFATTDDEPQKTIILSNDSGLILDENYKIVFHFPVEISTDDKIICYATYEKENTFIKYDPYSEDVVVLDPENIKISKVLSKDYVLAMDNEIISLYDFQTSKKKWSINLLEIFRNIPECIITESVCVEDAKCVDDVLILSVLNNSDHRSFLFGVSMDTSRLIWYKKSYTNFELFDNVIYNIEYDGLYRIVNPFTGKLKSEKNLEKDFERMDIRSYSSFNVTDSCILFKQGMKGKFGILNKKTFQVEEVCQLPDCNTICTCHNPILSGNRIYVFSALESNIFIYE